jgi:homopolymeric O-antigen transport system permease protein
MASAGYVSKGKPPWVELMAPWRIALSLYRHRSLLHQLIKRDVLGRYRGSFLGAFWSLLRPLAMLCMYAVVFGFIFQSRLSAGAEENRLDFTLALFCGLLLFDFFAESCSRAPTLVLLKPNYVTKVVFPLEILVVSAVGAALVQMCISLVPLVVALLVAHGAIPPTMALLPLILMPLILFALGLGWFLSSLGVFVRDINAVVPVALTILMFASAIFYSLDRVPAELQPLFLLNPIAALVAEARKVALWGIFPDWARLGVDLAASFLVAVAGYAFFMRTKSAFADVM